MFSLSEPGGFILELDGEVVRDSYGEDFLSAITIPFACDCQGSDAPNPPVSPPSPIDYQDFEDKRFGPYWKSDRKSAKIKKTDFADALDPTGIPETAAVELKDDATIFTETEISTKEIEYISLHFYLKFSKMKWKKGSKFSIEYDMDNGEGYKPIMEVQKGDSYALNDEPYWFLVEQPIRVGDADSIRFRLVLSGKGKAYIDHLSILEGWYDY